MVEFESRRIYIFQIFVDFCIFHTMTDPEGLSAMAKLAKLHEWPAAAQKTISHFPMKSRDSRGVHRVSREISAR